MAPEPQVAASDTEVPRPSTIAPRQSMRRWPLLWMLTLAVSCSLALWGGIFALISVISAALT